MSVQRIAKRYAQALLSLASDAQTEQRTDDDFEHINMMLRSSAELRALLRSPIIEGWRKKRICKELFESTVSPLMMEFLNLVFEKGRELHYVEIVSQYRRLLDLKRGVVRAEIVSAQEMGEPLRKSMVAALEKRTERIVLASYSVDKDLLGGAQVTMGDMVLDGSLRNQLAELKTRMVNG